VHSRDAEDVPGSLGRLRAFSRLSRPVVETMESDPADTPIVVQIARNAFLSVMITIAAWLVTNLRIELARRIFLYAVKLGACKERTIGLGR
jgi:hypothetical protein